jgi:hypothetical protein
MLPLLNRLKRYGSGNTNLILASLGNIVDVEVSKGNLSLTGIGAANIINYKTEAATHKVYIAIITCVCNLINETYPCKQDIAIGRMINNITTATTVW